MYFPVARIVQLSDKEISSIPSGGWCVAKIKVDE